MLWKWRRKLREPCEGPWCLVMPRRSLSFRASPGGLPVPVGCHVLSCLFSPGGLSCPVCLCLAPEGSWYPLTSPGNFFLGGKRVPAVGAGPRGPRPRPQGPPAMAPELPAPPWPPELPAPPWPPELPAPPWPPELPAPPWPPELPAPPWPPELPAPLWSLSVCSTLEVPILCSCPYLSWGASRAPTPPSPMELLRLGTSLSGGGSNVSPLSCVSCVPASCVLIWFVSCPCFMSLWVKCVPAVFVSLCVNYPVYISPVLWVWFRLVYSLLPGVSVSLPCLDVSIKDYYFELYPRQSVPVSSSCVHRDNRSYFRYIFKMEKCSFTNARNIFFEGKNAI